MSTWYSDISRMGLHVNSIPYFSNVVVLSTAVHTHNKYGCTMDQELANAAALSTGLTLRVHSPDDSTF